MKKIVALVLSLVMVLGLATTAFGASLSGTYDLWNTDSTGTTAEYTGVTLTPTDAVAPKDTDKDASLDTIGNVKFFDASGCPFILVQVGTVADADYVVKYAGKDTVFGYFVACTVAEARYVGGATPFTNFGEDCLQYDYEPEADVDYYFVAGVDSVVTGVYEAVDFGTGSFNVMVGGELVSLKATTATLVPHTPEFTYDKDYKVVAVKCAECGVVANIYDNYAAVPKADKAVAVKVNTDDYYVWTAAVAAPETTDKVESAETFDAGIAMYVGMSVMAAAGSAVVLKKKD